MTEFLRTNEPEWWWQRLMDYRFLPLILILSLALNLWGNRWGAPDSWHPDEVTSTTMSMVENRTLNPHYFPYGSLHYYLVGVGAIIPVKLYERISDPRPDGLETPARIDWHERHKTRIIQMARTISGLMSTLVVFFAFIMGNIVFDKRVGYLAALLLTVSMSFVEIAHFATVDAPANFWYWLSCLFAVFIWKRGDRLWYVLAAATAGLAIGTKVDRVLIVLPLVLSHFLRREGLQFRKLVLLATIPPATYLLANPTLFISPFEFLDGFTRDLFFNALRDKTQPSYPQILGYMKAGLGLPLFVTVLGGLAYGLYNLAQRKNLAGIIWLLSTFLPYLLLSTFKFSQPWYVSFFLPPLMIIAGYGCVNIMGVRPQRCNFAVRAALVVIVVYSLVNSIGLVLQFSYDARYLAAEWIEQYIPPDETIEMATSLGTLVSKQKYRIIGPPPADESSFFAGRVVHRLANHRTYQRVRQGILTLEKWAGGAFGLPVRGQPYMGWFDWTVAEREKSLKQLGTAGVQNQRPNYVVLIEDLRKGGLPGKALSAFQSQNSGYRLVAQFHFTNGLGIQPSFVFVNPYVYIFHREAKY